MKLKLSWQYFIAIIPLIFIMGETHELAHTTAGRLICGCWGQRDFNVWGLCSGCKDMYPVLSLFPTFIGPIYSFAIVWIGYYLLGEKKSKKSKIWGMTLVLTNILFARILTSLMASGDEVYGLRKVFDSTYLAWIIGALIVLLLSVPPLIRVYKVIANKNKGRWMTAALILPFLSVILFAVPLNMLLKSGFLNEVWIMGSPKLVTFWFFLSLIAFLISYKYIIRLKAK